MDREFLSDLFSEFGAVDIKRMFSGFGVSADGVNFALALRGGLYLRADHQSIPRFEAEGCGPFQYEARGKTVTVGSYWQLPSRLYDDPEELAQWAKVALDAARRAAAKKSKARKLKAKKSASPAKPTSKAVARVEKAAKTSGKKKAAPKKKTARRPSRSAKR